MKKIKPVLLMAMFIALQMMHTGCGKQKRNQYVTYEGYVYYQSGAPATDVPVVLEACGGGPGDKQHKCPGYKFTIKKTQTDLDGHFYIHEKASKTDLYFATIDKHFTTDNGVSAGTLTEDRFSNVHLWY
jgi:hypothetical protein